MSSTDDTPIENKKKEKKEVITDMSILGNWQLFLIELGKSLFKFLVIITIGSTIKSLADIKNEDEFHNMLDIIFPIDEEKLPYCWSGECKSEWPFPFNLPYQQLDRKDRHYPESGINVNWVVDWYEYTFMKSFILTRELLRRLYKGFSKMGKSKWGEGLIVFYVVAYLVYLMMFDTTIRTYISGIIIILGAFLFFFTSLDNREPEHRYMWSLFPLSYIWKFIVAAVLKLVNLEFLGMFLQLAALIATIIIGFGVVTFNIFWFIFIAWCVLVYIMIIVHPTIFYYSGISKCLDIIKSHGRSICAIVTLIIIYTAYNTLDLNVALGTLIVGFFLLIKLFRDEAMFRDIPTSEST